MRRIRIAQQLRKNRPENANAERIDENRKDSDNSESYGVYYVFCDLVFNLEEYRDIGERLERVRKM